MTTMVTERIPGLGDWFIVVDGASMTPCVMLPVEFIDKAHDRHGVWNVDMRSLARVARFHAAKEIAGLDWDYAKQAPIDTLKEWATVLDGFKDYEMAMRHKAIVDLLATFAPPKRKPRSPAGYIYLAKAGPRYKIGRSVHPAKRIAELNNGQTPYPIELIAARLFEDAVRAEAEYHTSFSRRRSHGEWFDLDPAEVQHLTNELSMEKPRQ